MSPNLVCSQNAEGAGGFRVLRFKLGYLVSVLHLRLAL